MEKFDKINEELEATAYERDLYKSKVAEATKMLTTQKTEYRRLKNQMMLFQKQNREKELKYNIILKSNESLLDLIYASETFRKKQSDILNKELADSDVQRNRIFSLNNSKILQELQYSKITEKML